MPKDGSGVYEVNLSQLVRKKIVRKYWLNKILVQRIQNRCEVWLDELIISFWAKWDKFKLFQWNYLTLLFTKIEMRHWREITIGLGGILCNPSLFARSIHISITPQDKSWNVNMTYCDVMWRIHCLHKKLSLLCLLWLWLGVKTFL